MKAIHVTKVGGPEVMEQVDIPVPTAGPGMVLLKNEVIAINFHDINARRFGEPGLELPYIPGCDFAGVVEAVGEGVTDFAPGDRVLGTGGHGAYAEYTNVAAQIAMPIPDDISFEQAVCCPVAGLTAHFLLVDNHTDSHSTVVATAAAGSVGCFLGGLMRKMGAHSIGLVSTEKKKEVALKAGWDEVIIYTEEDPIEGVSSRTDGKGADLMLDAVAGPDFGNCFNMVRVGGTVVLYGVAAGAFPPESINTHFLGAMRNLGMRTFFLGTTMVAELERIRPAYEELFTGWRAGDFYMPMENVPLADAADAHTRIESQQTMGKVLLIP